MNVRVAVAVTAMVAASFAAIGLSPHRVIMTTPERLQITVPDTFAEWHRTEDLTRQVSLMAVDENGQNPMDETYDDSLLRTYVDAAGNRMMLAIAYDKVQREEDRVHRPEICYIAQGFSILSDKTFTFAFNGPLPPIEGRRMLARHGNRLEAVSFWIRTGDVFTQNPWRSRSYVITEGLAGRLQDGILVRASEIISSTADAADSFKRQSEFLNSLVAATSPSAGFLLARRHP